MYSKCSKAWYGLVKNQCTHSKPSARYCQVSAKGSDSHHGGCAPAAAECPLTGRGCIPFHPFPSHHSTSEVWEIVEFGLDREEYAVQAVAEAFVQLQQQTTHPVLVVVDAWNECFPCSEYVLLLQTLLTDGSVNDGA